MLSWFGVRTIHRVMPVGKRLGSDSVASDDFTLIEERVVLVRAHNPKEAMRKGEAEAKRYAAECRHRNPYGQRVATRYLGFCDVYDMCEPVKDGVEVFSVNEVVSRRVSDRTIISRLIGRPESDKTYRSRRNILDIAFNGPAPGVILTRSERAFAEKLHARLKRKKTTDA
jgi:hypothetical protein